MDVTEKRRRFIVNAAYFAILCALVFLAFRYILPIAWPFLAAFLFAWMLRPAIRRLTERRWRYLPAAIVCLVLFFLVLGGLAALVANRLVAFGADGVTRLPELYKSSIAPGLERLSAWAEQTAARLGPEAVRFVETAAPEFTSSVASAVSRLSVSLVSAVSGWAAALPRVLLSGLVCIIATVFMTLDFPRITAFLMRQLPEDTRAVVREAKNTFVRVIVQYAKSYGIIMLITFGEILAALLLIRQKNAFLIAAAVAVFDIFPIVGAWMVLVPWAIVTLLSGGVAKGLALIALWIIEVVVRQIIEPRIVGQHVGLHPVATLAAMFIGAKLFGGAGLLGLPILCAIVHSLDAAGVIRILRREGAQEEKTAKKSAPGS